ncbi:MAG: TrkA C-terminal domain-containing protein, partial [Verrucomicrobiota bacterium]|nr:TrkA C-terminal domain-containing protein [Verrucomicrobiota bacterium]
VEDFEKFNPAGVVACEVEGGLEVLSRVLRKLQVPRNLIIREIDDARNQTMRSDRSFKEAPLPLEEHQELKELTVETILLMAGSRADGKSPREMDLAERTGILVIAIKREQRLLLHRLAETTLLADDLVYCIGKKTDLEIGSEWFDPSISKD